MQLTYRGLHYSFNPSNTGSLSNEAETVAIGSYRGASMRVCKLQKALVQQPGQDLKYRGTVYNTGGTARKAAVPEVVVAGLAPTLTDNKARTLVLAHQRAMKQRHQAMLSRFASELGLKGLSASQQSIAQVNVEPILWTASDRSYDRSHVAFS